MIANLGIRQEIRRNLLRSYEVAGKLQIAQSTFFYRLQRPLNEKQTAEIMQAIRELAAEKEKELQAVNQ